MGSESLHLSTLFERQPRAISVKLTIQTGPQQARSTPAKKATKTRVRLNLDTIPEQSQESSTGSGKSQQIPAQSFEASTIFVPPFPPLNQYQEMSEVTERGESEGVDLQVPALKNNVMSSRNCLTYQPDNLVHFISEDCKYLGSVGRLLTNIEPSIYRRFNGKTHRQDR